MAAQVGQKLGVGDSIASRDTIRAAAGGAVAGTAISGLFHRFGPPKMAIARPWATATLGVGLMTAMSAGLLHATNNDGKANSLLGSALLSSVAFGVPGIWIHGKMDFSGKPVASWKGALGVAATGALVGPLIHLMTTPD